MRWRWAAVVALLALAAGAVIALNSGGGGRPDALPSPTVVGDDSLLLGSSARDVDAAAALARRLGADWLSLRVDWRRLAPDGGGRRRPAFDATDPAAYPPGRWSRLDRAVRSAHAHGLGVLLELAGRPPLWASADRTGRQYGAFATAVARRYSGRLRGLPRAAAFVVGDEPNRLPASAPASLAAAQVLADRYRAMVTSAVPAVRRAAPGALVLMGGTAAPAAGRPAATDTVDPVAFLQDLACVSPRGAPRRDGPCATFRPLPGDGWAHHPGPLGSSSAAGAGNRRQLGRLAALLIRLRAQRRLAGPMPVFVTRYCEAQAGGTRPYPQARRLAEAEWLARGIPVVRGWAQAPLRDRPPDFCGLQEPGGASKPALGAFAYPLVVHRAGPETVTMWGRVRPAGRRGRFRVAVQLLDGSWRSLPQFRRGRRTGPGGYFELEARTGPGGVPIDPGATYRLELLDEDRGWRPAGLPIIGAAPGPAPRR